ncbi:anthrone oxygenase family protein [Marinomonas epiphytica]
MSFQIQPFLTLICLITTSLLAGLYFIFHNTLMPVLKEQDASQIMHRVNEVIINKYFLTVFMMSPISALYLLLVEFSKHGLNFMSVSMYGEICALSAFIITAFKNVPLNHCLAQMLEHDSTIWGLYLNGWSRWNSVRYYLSLSASTFMLTDLLYG